MGLTDLLVATVAVAEQHQITVLHHESAYDTISELTGVQPLWVVERGDIAWLSRHHRSGAEEHLRTQHQLTVEDAADADLGQRRVEQVGAVAG